MCAKSETQELHSQFYPPIKVETHEIILPDLDRSYDPNGPSDEALALEYNLASQVRKRKRENRTPISTTTLLPSVMATSITPNRFITVFDLDLSSTLGDDWASAEKPTKNSLRRVRQQANKKKIRLDHVTGTLAQYLGFEFEPHSFPVPLAGAISGDAIQCGCFAKSKVLDRKNGGSYSGAGPSRSAFRSIKTHGPPSPYSRPPTLPTVASNSASRVSNPESHIGSKLSIDVQLALIEANAIARERLWLFPEFRIPWDRML
ncbi:hypothetical protein BJ138DRAFT_1164493 [Hygrophoropsis aurantiaca]|uniref:Uncharacterized protein n=1 Tax=Hygrophoropsis aurantiaca TaxID=72124 RepID=A0ACB7ZY28_9AGAM|nr:hypothetical protein BJ138DRAFT_1164493 [Hygrophoropsis aurantiaca]